MNRVSRQAKILEIISNKAIDTQEELVNQLRQAGYNVTQATISRDIKELNLVKTLYNGDCYKYIVGSQLSSLSDKMLSIFRQTVVSVNIANNIVIVKTLQASAMTVANIIDKLSMPQVLAIVPAIDALVIVTENEQQAHQVVYRLDTLLN